MYIDPGVAAAFEETVMRADREKVVKAKDSNPIREKSIAQLLLQSRGGGGASLRLLQTTFCPFSNQRKSLSFVTAVSFDKFIKVGETTRGYLLMQQ